MRLCRLNPHFSKQVHHTFHLNSHIRVSSTNLPMIFLKTVNVTTLYFILTVGENGTHLVGCMGLRKHPTNKSGKPAPRPGPPPEEVGWNRPAPRPERRYFRPPPLVPKSFQFCWTLTRNTAKKLLKTHLLICELFQFKNIISSVGHANCTCNHQTDCTTQSIYNQATQDSHVFKSKCEQL